MHGDTGGFGHAIDFLLDSTYCSLAFIDYGCADIGKLTHFAISCAIGRERHAQLGELGGDLSF